jgi:hypothetical protein
MILNVDIPTKMKYILGNEQASSRGLRSLFFVYALKDAKNSSMKGN